jgi:hypothetical protein
LIAVLNLASRLAALVAQPLLADRTVAAGLATGCLTINFEKRTCVSGTHRVSPMGLGPAWGAKLAEAFGA